MVWKLYALVFDSGCFVLIWLVQLVIYPSFQHYTALNLKAWHRKYTKLISFVVLPLMLGQLLFGIIGAFDFEYLNLIKLVLILATWATTFILFVPLHNKVEKGKNLKEIAAALVYKNWIRTGLWSLVFFLSIAQNLIP